MTKLGDDPYLPGEAMMQRKISIKAAVAFVGLVTACVPPNGSWQSPSYSGGYGSQNRGYSQNGGYSNGGPSQNGTQNGGYSSDDEGDYEGDYESGDDNGDGGAQQAGGNANAGRGRNGGRGGGGGGGRWTCWGEGSLGTTLGTGPTNYENVSWPENGATREAAGVAAVNGCNDLMTTKLQLAWSSGMETEGGTCHVARCMSL